MFRAIWTWFVAARPWCYSVSFVPLILGSLLAGVDGYPLRWGLLALILTSGVFLHTGVNYLNTYGDFVSGVDTLESADSDLTLVSGILPASSVRVAGLVFLGLAAVLGLILALLTGWPVLLYGALGLAGGYCYTTGPKPYKYIGLGPLLVFFLMGPFMVCPAYYVQTGQVPFSVVWISLSIGCVVTGLIQANDIHDVVHDRISGIRTMALTIGQGRAMAGLSLIYISAYLILFVSVTLGFLPWPALAPVLALPELIRTIHGMASKSRRERTVAGLVYWAAGFHAKFGALLIVGIIIYLVFIR